MLGTSMPLRMPGRRLRYLGLAVLTGLALFVLPLLAPPVQAGALDYEPDLEAQLFTLMNQQRATQGLPPLQEHWLLQQVARIRSWDMANRRYFSHYSPETLSAFDMFNGLGLSGRTTGENIGYNYLDSSGSAREMIRMFMASPPHAAQILSRRFRYAGIGEVTNSAGARYYTMLFSD